MPTMAADRSNHWRAGVGWRRNSFPIIDAAVRNDREVRCAVGAGADMASWLVYCVGLSPRPPLPCTLDPNLSLPLLNERTSRWGRPGARSVERCYRRCGKFWAAGGAAGASNRFCWRNSCRRRAAVERVPTPVACTGSIFVAEASDRTAPENSR